jgi:hypothetical protein
VQRVNIRYLELALAPAVLLGRTSPQQGVVLAPNVGPTSTRQLLQQRRRCSVFLALLGRSRYPELSPVLKAVELIRVDQGSMLTKANF